MSSFLDLHRDDSKQSEAGVLNEVPAQHQHTATCRRKRHFIKKKKKKSQFTHLDVFISYINALPSCTSRLSRTKVLARNRPQPQLESMYSLCSDHCNHILSPSSRKVLTRHRRPT